VAASTSTIPGDADDQKPDDIVKRRRVRRRKASSTDTKKLQDNTISSTKNSLINETGLEPKAEINNKPAADPDKPIKPKTENTNSSNVIVVGETEEKKPNNDRGGWWNKITGG